MIFKLQLLFTSLFVKPKTLKYLSSKVASTSIIANNNEECEINRVHAVYANSAQSYDRMIDLATFGQQNYWKWELVKMINPTKGTRLLDAAGGQGAITIRCLQYIKSAGIEDCELFVCDVNKRMMEQGQKKLGTLNYDLNSIKWIQGDAQNLPFSNETFNVYSISLGFRGINIEKTFQEAYRVLKPGSPVYCLEVNRPDNFAMAKIHWFGFKYIVPMIGTVIFRTYEPFSYFIDMHPKIPHKEKLKAIIESAGFSNVSYKNLSFGTAAIHWGYKL